MEAIFFKALVIFAATVAIQRGWTFSLLMLIYVGFTTGHGFEPATTWLTSVTALTLCGRWKL